MSRKQERDDAGQTQSSSSKEPVAAVISVGAKQLLSEGRQHQQFGRLSEAVVCYRRVLAIDPEHSDALYSLGVSAHQMGRHDAAVKLIGRAIRLDRQNSFYFSHLGIALQALGRLDDAIAAYRQAIVVKPDNAEAHSNLGTALYHQGKAEQAIIAYRQAIGIIPNYAEIHYNLGIALHFQGRVEEAIGAYRHALAFKPDFVEAFSNLLLCQNYDDRVSAKQLFVAHREWDERCGRGASRPKTYVNDRDLGRRLRIGYLSPDFRMHSVAYFFAPLLKAHDRQAVEIFCYAEVSRPDKITSRLQGLADQWLVTVGLSDKDLADRIRSDGIDVLVDLAGHSPNNRLRVFAYKPAPVQVTWLGYPNTTGLDAMDYRMVDAVTDPIGGADGCASETLIRLENGFLCYEGSREAPEPRARARATTNAITFGSFNNLNKVSTSTLDAWAKLLIRLPEARLLLKGIPFTEEGPRASLLAKFRERGIAAERIELVASLPNHAAHLALYHRIDIALDTFPYCGTTTTCEALWMGVPVVTLCGDRHAARVGASLLNQIGLTYLIANSIEEYVEIAVALSRNSERLNDLHRSLRAHMADSPLCNAQGFARKIESAFRQMWHAWCQAPAQENSLNITDALQKAANLHCNGKLAEAALLYQAIVEFRPNCFDALHMRGVILFQQGFPAEAYNAVRAALKLNPTSVEALSNLGMVLTRLGRAEEALASYDEAIAVQPGCAEAFFNRGNTLKERGRAEEALASYDKAIALKPNYLKALFNRGNTLQDLERTEEALASYDRALAVKPDYVDALNNRGGALLRLKRPEDALASYDKAITVQPDCAEAYSGRGAALTVLKRHDDALKSYDKAVSIKPDLAEAWSGRGDILLESNLNDQAIESFGRALAHKPDFAEMIFASCLAELQIQYSDEREIDERREAYGRKLRTISNNLEMGDLKGDLIKGIAAKQPFYLAYQGCNDRDLQALYGSVVRRVVEREYPDAWLAPPPARGERVRVGFVSAFFREHSNWRIPIKGWLSQLDRKRFEIYGYYLGKERDEETDVAASLCDRFVQGELSVRGWRREILSDLPHVLIYPGLLMEGMSLQLAAQRLAPVQCNSWGHPATSGMPTLDYYLGGDFMEPPDADRHYTERLIRLPNLSIYYEPIEWKPVPISRSEFALRPDSTRFWCGQSLFKYLPQFDNVFARIARAAPNSQFIFLRHHGAQRVTTLFQKRLERAFSELGLATSDHCVFLDRLSPRQFAAAVGQCDVFLDSIGWSGCNSTMDAVAYDRPIVTLPGPFMRARHSAAILRMMGIDETIAESVDDFVSIAARLARDMQARQALSQKTAERKHLLYRDGTCISALENFLEDAARGIS